MPKANAKDVYYFSHDCNARNDEKVLAMRSVYGLEGYAMYFMLVEILREQQDFKLKETKYIWNTLAMQIGVDAEKVKKFVTDCVDEFELFVSENGYLFSASLIKRMNLFREISEIRSKAAKARWESQQQKADDNAKSMQKHSTCNANALQKNTSAMQNDANKSKLNYTKSNYTKLDKTKKEDINKRETNNSDETPDGESSFSEEFQNRSF